MIADVFNPFAVAVFREQGPLQGLCLKHDIPASGIIIEIKLSRHLTSIFQYADSQRCSIKKVFLKICKFIGKYLCRSFFFNKSTFFTEHFLATASSFSKKKYKNPNKTKKMTFVLSELSFKVFILVVLLGETFNVIFQ